MKKVILLTLSLTTGLGLLAQSQTSSSSGMSSSSMGTGGGIGWGLDVGANFSKFDLDKKEFANPALAPDVKNKTSFHAGVFLNIPIGGVFSLKPQVIYSRQGSILTQKTATGTGTTTTEYEEDLAYIHVAPAALHILTKQGFMLETGPLLGYLVSAEQDGPAPYNNSNIRNSRNKIDLLWNAGVGFLTKAGIGAHARYVYGFSNVLNTSGSSTPMGEYHNRIIQVGLMYHFGHKGMH